MTFDTGPYLEPFMENPFNVQHDDDSDVQEACTDVKEELISQSMPDSEGAAVSQEILFSIVSQDSERELHNIMPQDSVRQSLTAISQVSEGESFNAWAVPQNTPDSEEELLSQSMRDSTGTRMSQNMPANVSLECSSMRLVTGMSSLRNVASTEELATWRIKITGISSAEVLWLFAEFV